MYIIFIFPIGNWDNDWAIASTGDNSTNQHPFEELTRSIHPVAYSDNPPSRKNCWQFIISMRISINSNFVVVPIATQSGPQWQNIKKPSSDKRASKALGSSHRIKLNKPHRLCNIFSVSHNAIIRLGAWLYYKRMEHKTISILQALSQKEVFAS